MLLSSATRRQWDGFEAIMQSAIQRFLSGLESERGFSANTISAYRNDLGQFVAYLMAPPETDHLSAVTAWAEVDEAHMNVYLLHLHSRDYASSTVARKTAAIKSFCHFLTVEGIVRADLSANMTTPKVDKYVPRAITVDEIDLLLAQPGSTGDADKPEAIRDQAMLETLYSTGMRVSELVAIDQADLNLESHTVRCVGKAGRERYVPLRPSACVALARYLEEARPMLAPDDEISLFVNHRGHRLTRQGFWLILKSYAERANIGDITPHTLRHSFAAHALRHGAELKDVQHLLGHVSISTTQVYRKLASELNAPVLVAAQIEPAGAGSEA
jgi:integrase/recombinase XerD